MIVEITRDMDIASYKLEKGMTFNTIDCPLEESQLLFDEGVWIDNETPIRLLNGEYQIIELNQEEEFGEQSFVSGKDFTKIVREAYLDEKTDYLEELRDSIGIPVDVFRKILIGKASLSTIGVNDIVLNEEIDVTYQKYLTDRYSKYLFINNRFYEPVSFIGNYGRNDRLYLHNLEESYNEIDTTHCFNYNSLNSKKKELAKRSKFYMSNNESKIAFVKYSGKNVFVLFEPITIPMELLKYVSRTAEDSVSSYEAANKYKTLNFLGFSEYCQDYGINDYTIEYNQFAEVTEEEVLSQLDTYKQEILEKSKFLGFKSFEFEGETFNVPIAPFILNVAPMYTALHELYYQVKETYGLAVCPSGLKMRGDSGYHSDWVLGSGLDLDTFYMNYDKNTEFYTFISELEEEIVEDISINLKNINKSTSTSNILFSKISQNNEVGSVFLVNSVNENDINNILDITSQNGGVVLTSTSSMVSHLVSNSMELNFDMFSTKIFNLLETSNDIFQFDTIKNCVNIVSKTGTPLSMLRHGNAKANMLAYLKSKSIMVVDGIYYDSLDNLNVTYPRGDYIVRSSGSNEGDSLKASGIFISEQCKSVDISENIRKVFNSFSSDLANKYLNRIKAEVTPGVLVQPFIKSELSVVIKSINNQVHISYVKGDCSLIVDNDSSVLHVVSEIGEMENQIENSSPLLMVYSEFKKIQNILNITSIECEFVVKDNIVYTNQAMIL
jgi:hypothetical protein